MESKQIEGNRNPTPERVQQMVRYGTKHDFCILLTIKDHTVTRRVCVSNRANQHHIGPREPYR